METKLIKCRKCDGKGTIDHNRPPKSWIHAPFDVCPKCNGKGKISKKIKEVA